MPELPPLAVTGMPGCGKGYFSEQLEGCGYHAFSTGEFVREGLSRGEHLEEITPLEAVRRMLLERDWLDTHRNEIPGSIRENPDRDLQGLYASACTEMFGGDYFIRKGLAGLPPPHLVDGLRRPSEVDAFLDIPRSVLVYVHADAGVRRRLTLERGSGRDALTDEEFALRDAAELGNGTKINDPHARNMRYAQAMAHAEVVNDGTGNFDLAIRSFVNDLAAGRFTFTPGRQQARYGQRATSFSG